MKALWCVVLVALSVSCKDEAARPAAAVAAAELQGGTQVVRVRVTDMGYVPKAVELKAGVPARLIFIQESKGECGAQVHLPAFNVKKTELPFGKETAVEFTPAQAGSFQWLCGMDMMKGAIIVKGS
ncbi:MAG: cupredoxin domain-containing protein [Deltaproteobacteria bacterium]|nr:cupredoxin domain-containing protein [Deltaproteobacteria bacterium]